MLVVSHIREHIVVEIDGEHRAAFEVYADVHSVGVIPRGFAYAYDDRERDEDEHERNDEREFFELAHAETRISVKEGCA